MAERPVPEKRKSDPSAPKEWRDIQCPCVKWLREFQQTHKDLEFIATLTEAKRDVARAAVAKAMGLKRGPHDLLLFRRIGTEMRTCWVEFKLPGKPLSDEQHEWRNWFSACGVPCFRVDNIQEFQRIVIGFMA